MRTTFKVSPAPRVRLDAMSSYALRPFGLVGGPGLPAGEEPLLRAWADKKLAVLVASWDGTIEDTEDAVAGRLAL